MAETIKWSKKLPELRGHNECNHNQFPAWKICAGPFQMGILKEGIWAGLSHEGFQNAFPIRNCSARQLLALSPLQNLMQQCRLPRTLWHVVSVWTSQVPHLICASICLPREVLLATVPSTMTSEFARRPHNSCRWVKLNFFARALTRCSSRRWSHSKEKLDYHIPNLQAPQSR